MRLHHSNLRVLDPVPSVEFYRRLGLQLVGCNDLGDMTVLYLGVPGDSYLLELTVNPAGGPEWAGSAGTGHLALTVPDLDATLARLRDSGVEPVVGPFHPGGNEKVYVCFLEDPTGYRVELIDGDLVPNRDELPSPLEYG